MYKPVSGAPLTKVTASTVAGAIVALIVWLLQTYAHAEVPSDVAASLVVLVMAFIAYLTPLLPGEIRPVETTPATTSPVLGHGLQLATLGQAAAPDEAALTQARAAAELAEDAHGRLDELAAQVAQALGDAPGAG